jgi:hypothetical protein
MQMYTFNRWNYLFEFLCWYYFLLFFENIMKLCKNTSLKNYFIGEVIYPSLRQNASFTTTYMTKFVII